MVAKYPLDSLHITQTRHPVYNPDGEEISENCGPTSLAIACLTLGKTLLAIPGLATPSTSQEAIDSARYWMFSRADGSCVDQEKRGIKHTSQGAQRCPAAHMTLVNLPDLELGARNLGLVARRVETWEDLSSQFHHPHPILLAGDPSFSRVYSELLEVEYQGGHVVVLQDMRGDRFLLSDPLSFRGACWVSQDILREFAAPAPFGKTLGLGLSL